MAPQALARYSKLARSAAGSTTDGKSHAQHDAAPPTSSLHEQGPDHSFEAGPDRLLAAIAAILPTS